MNYTSFVNKFRIDEAMTLLVDKRYRDLNMEDISDMVGFANRQSFYASFYKINGITPREYKLRHYQQHPADTKVPKKRGRKPKAKEEAPVVQLSGPIRIEAEEPEKVEVLPVSMDAIPADGPLMRGGMEYRVTGISVEIGDWMYYPRNKYLDWIPSACPEEVVSMNVEEWLQLLSDLPKIMEVLGVKP